MTSTKKEEIKSLLSNYGINVDDYLKLSDDEIINLPSEFKELHKVSNRQWYEVLYPMKTRFKIFIAVNSTIPRLLKFTCEVSEIDDENNQKTLTKKDVIDIIGKIFKISEGKLPDNFEQDFSQKIDNKENYQKRFPETGEHFLAVVSLENNIFEIGY